MRVAFVGSTSTSHGHGMLGHRLIQATSNRVTWKEFRFSEIPHIKKSDFDLMYVTSGTAMNFIREPDLPIVLHLGGESTLRPEWLDKITRIIVVAPSIASSMSKLTSKVVLLENAVPDDFSPGSPDPLLPKRGPTVLYCGRPYPIKRTDLLVKSFETLPYDLWLVGALPFFPIRGTPNVRAWDHQIDVLKFYRTADVFILPSVTEGMCLALLEAMACGMPCIVSDIPQNRDTIRDGGVLCQLTVDSMRDTIRRVLSDAGLRQDLSRRALEVGRTRRYEDWVDQLLAILGEACSSSS